jgi:hypothetical protein
MKAAAITAANKNVGQQPVDDEDEEVVEDDEDDEAVKDDEDDEVIKDDEDDVGGGHRSSGPTGISIGGQPAVVRVAV